jgi:hypothetical protein
MQQPLSDADARFDRTMGRWFRELLEMDPEMATYVGIHDHDHRLSEGSREQVEREVAFHRASRQEMERFDSADLSPDRAIDRDLVIHESRLAEFQLTERREWAGASHAAEHVGNALFPIFTRDYAPMTERMAAIASRLEDVPRYLAASRSRTEAPVRLWVEIDLESTATLPSFLELPGLDSGRGARGAAGRHRRRPPAGSRPARPRRASRALPLAARRSPPPRRGRLARGPRAAGGADPAPRAGGDR